MKRYFIALSVIGWFVLSSCHFSTQNFGTESGSQINSADRNKVFSQSNKIYRAFKQNDFSVLKGMALDDAKKYFDNIEGVGWEKVGVDPLANDLRMEGEYLVVGNPANKAGSVSGGNYTLSFPVLTEETYVAMFSIPQISKGCRALTTCVYANDHDEWKLTAIRLGYYTYQGKNARQYFDAVKEAYSKGNLLEAYERMLISVALSKPANEMLRYNDLDEMNAFGNKLVTEAKEKFKFPINVSLGSGRGAISGVNIIEKSDIFPVVSIDMSTFSQGNQLKNEIIELNSHVEKYLPGIAAESDSIVYYITSKSAEQTSTTQFILPVKHS